MKLCTFNFIKLKFLTEAIIRNTLDNIKRKFKVPDLENKISSQLNPYIPKTEEQFIQLMDKLEKMSPDTKTPSPYVQYLAQTLLCIPPTWQLGEDDQAVIAELKQVKSLKDKQIPIDITSFTARPDLITKLAELSNRGTKFSGIDAADVKTHVMPGATKILEQGNWSVWKVPRGATEANKKAAWHLCRNKVHGTSWCVGYETNPVTSYLGKGDFFVMQKNHISKYAVSVGESGPGEIKIYNPADSPIFDSSTLSGSNTNTSNYIFAEFPNIIKTLTNLGITPSTFFESLSYIPEELKPIIAKLQTMQESRAAFSKVPTNFLTEISEDNKQLIYKVLHTMDNKSIVSDINNASIRQVSVLFAYSILTFLVAPHKGKILSVEDLAQFTINGLMAYLEAHANTFDRNMSKEIHVYLKQVMS